MKNFEYKSFGTPTVEYHHRPVMIFRGLIKNQLEAGKILFIPGGAEHITRTESITLHGNILYSHDARRVDLFCRWGKASPDRVMQFLDTKWVVGPKLDSLHLKAKYSGYAFWTWPQFVEEMLARGDAL